MAIPNICCPKQPGTDLTTEWLHEVHAHWSKSGFANRAPHRWVLGYLPYEFSLIPHYRVSRLPQNVETTIRT